MTAADYAAIIESDEMWGHSAVDVLAAKVPALCPTCGGKGTVEDGWSGSLGEARHAQCDHRYAPTIDVLLAEATGVRRLAQEFGVTTSALLSLGYLSLLRAVQP